MNDHHLVQNWYSGSGQSIYIKRDNHQWSVEPSSKKTDNLLIPSLIDLHAVISLPEHTENQTYQLCSDAYANGIAVVLNLPARDLDHQYQWHYSTITIQGDNLAKVYQCLPLTYMEKGNRVPSNYQVIESDLVRALLISDQDLLDTKTLLKCLQLVQPHNHTIFSEPNWLPLCQDGLVHQGVTAARKGLDGVSPAAETIALQAILDIIRETGNPLHITGISCARSVEIIAQAKKEALEVTADTSIMHLSFTDESLVDFNSEFKVWPPLRAREDQQALIEGIRNGTIDAITSYHTPRSKLNKLVPFKSAAIGTSTFPSYANNILSFAKNNNIDIPTIISACCNNPAKILGIDNNSMLIIDKERCHIYENHSRSSIKMDK